MKPGSITVVDAATLSVERVVNGLDPDARGRWNNPHRLPVVYVLLEAWSVGVS